MTRTKIEATRSQQVAPRKTSRQDFAELDTCTISHTRVKAKIIDAIKLLAVGFAIGFLVVGPWVVMLWGR